MEKTSAEVLIGHKCGQSHLGVNFTEQANIFERAERADRLTDLRAELLQAKGRLVAEATATIENRELQLVGEIAQAVFELSREARKALDRAAAGTFTDVSGLSAFLYPSPKSSARSVVSLLNQLEETHDIDQIEKITRELRNEVEDHNRKVKEMANGTRGLTRENIQRLNEKMPMVDITITGSTLTLARMSDNLKRTFRIPERFRLRPIELP